MDHESVRAVSRRSAWLLTLVATFTMAISYVDRQTLSVLAPTVMRALRLTEVQYGWLASAFSIAYLVGAPLAGRLIDRVGARRGLLGAVLLWSLVAGLHALAPGFAVLFALRIALGLAESPSFPGAAQTVHRALPPADRARGFGILFTGSSLGAMVAPLLATWIESRFGWRIAFLGTAIVGLIWVPIWWSVAFSREGRSVLDRASAATSSEPVAPLAWRQVALHPAVLRALVLVIASSPAIALVLLWGAKFFVRHYGLTQAQLGAYLWAPPVLFDLGAVVFGDLSSRRARARKNDGSPDRLLIAVAALLAMCLALMPYGRNAFEATLLAGVSLAGGGAIFALLTSDMMSRVPPAAVSLAGGCTAAAQSLAYIVANPLIGRGVEQFHGYTEVLLILGLWIVPGVTVWLVVTPPPIHVVAPQVGQLDEAPVRSA